MVNKKTIYPKIAKKSLKKKSRTSRYVSTACQVVSVSKLNKEHDAHIQMPLIGLFNSLCHFSGPKTSYLVLGTEWVKYHKREKNLALELRILSLSSP